MAWYWVIAISFGSIVLQGVWLVAFYDAIVGATSKNSALEWSTAFGYGLLVGTWPIIILLGNSIHASLLIQALVAIYLICLALYVISLTERFPFHQERNQ